MKIIEKHSLLLRLNHWLNVPLLALMMWSGVLIYWANDVYPFFFPDMIYNVFGLSHKLAEGLATHFLIGWLFLLNGLIYLFYLLLSGHWRELMPTAQTLRDALPTILHDLGLSKTAPAHGKFNAMQKLAYSGVIAMAIGEVLSGFAIYKPVQLGWLTMCFGGYQGARLVHFAIMVALAGFIGMHVVQVVRAGWNNFRAMVAGFAVENDK